MSQQTHYQTLGVAPTASAEVIRAAYRRLAMKWHPDRHTGDIAKSSATAQFKLIQGAYDTLSDPVKRANYDALHGRASGAASGSDDFSSFYEDLKRHDAERQQRYRDHAEDLAREQAERERRLREKLPRGADVKWKVKVSVADALHGVVVEYKHEDREECEVCDGDGSVYYGCMKCSGAGFNVDPNGMLRKCAYCHGQGATRKSCEECNGKGTVKVSRVIKLRLPPGVIDGTELISAGLGKASKEGGLPGDLHVIVNLKPERGFVFSGANVTGPIKVPFSVALLGGRVVVELPTGRSLSVLIPERSNSGKKLKFEGAGLTDRDGSQGDLTLTVAIVLPLSKRKLSAAEEHIVRSLDH